MVKSLSFFLQHQNTNGVWASVCSIGHERPAKSDQLINLEYMREQLRFESKCSAAVSNESGRVLDSRPKGCGFEPHRRHCVKVLEQDTFILA